MMRLAGTIIIAALLIIGLSGCYQEFPEIPGRSVDKFRPIEEQIYAPLNINLSRFKSLDQVNSFVNRFIEYTKDEPGHDTWQTPNETLRLRTGDCEDIALLKLAIIRQKFPTANPKLLLMRDVVSRSGHAAVLVQDSVVLDNQYQYAYAYDGKTFKGRYIPLFILRLER